MGPSGIGFDAENIYNNRTDQILRKLVNGLSFRMINQALFNKFGVAFDVGSFSAVVQAEASDAITLTEDGGLFRKRLPDIIFKEISTELEREFKSFKPKGKVNMFDAIHVHGGFDLDQHPEIALRIRKNELFLHGNVFDGSKLGPFHNTVSMINRELRSLQIPKFSVLMPVYWREDPAAFKAALDSVFANTLIPDEVVVVCDGPLNPELDQIIEDYSTRPDFRTVRFDENKGIVTALNRGIEEVSHEVVVRCDSDDVNHSDRFAKLLAKLGEGYSVVGSQIEEVNATGQTIARKQLPTTHDDIVRYARRRNPINHMTVAFRNPML